MKTLILLFGTLITIPIGAVVCSKISLARKTCFTVMIFFTSVSMMFHLDSMPNWRGTAWGYQLSMVDISGAILLLSFKLSGKKIKWLPPGVWCYFLYAFFIFLSGVSAKYLPQWSYEAYKMIWMYLAFVTFYTYLYHFRSIDFILKIMAIMCIMMFLQGLYQKYVIHIYQIRCSMPHQNSLAMYLIIFVSILLGVVLNEKLTKKELYLYVAGAGCGGLLEVFTLSRGGIIALVLSGSIVAFGSVVLNGLNQRKILLFLAGGLAIIIGTAIVLPRVIDRFLNAPETSGSGRKYLAIAAVRIANDHKLGVGANNFCEYTSMRHSYATEHHEMEQRKDDTDSDDFMLGSVVETVYLLVAAECGWGGLAALLIWYLYYFKNVLFEIFMFSRKPLGGLSLGCFAAVCSNYAQSALEWVSKQYNNFYQLMLLYAIIAFMWHFRKELRKRVPLEELGMKKR